jgi:protein phosphatase
VRDHNEDRYSISSAPEPATDEAWEGWLDPNKAWALIADGMGGHAAGEVASRTALDVLRHAVDQKPTTSEVASWLQAADATLRQAMVTTPSLNGMGTTVAGVIISDGLLTMFNVGDSRIYIQQSGALTQLSEDHVVNDYMLTQCLGGSSDARVLSPCIKVERLQLPCRILLCSDGLTDLVSDGVIEQLLRSSLQPARTLVKAALVRGGVDNVTVIVLHVQDNSISEYEHSSRPDVELTFFVFF